MSDYFNFVINVPVFLFLIIRLNLAYGEVKPPNYDFSLDELKQFSPGKSIKAIKLKKETISKKGGTTTYKYYVAQLRYKFPVFVQEKDDKILDFYATLPNYFLHNIFHQSLINRIGKQQKYLLSDEHAVYKWNNKNGKSHIYAAACTITCFPLYYTVAPSKETRPAGFRSLHEQFIKTEIELKSEKK